MSQESRSFFSLRRIVCAVLAFVMTAALLPGCQMPSTNTPAPQENPTPIVSATEAHEDVTEPAPTEAPTEPGPTAPPDGNPDDATCKGSYHTSVAELAAASQNTVATVGDVTLSNGLLQIYYQMAVSAYRTSAQEIQPDYAQPLDVQMCPLENDAITWQQYFLQQALATWQRSAAMVQRSKTEPLPLEEAYGRNEQKHEENKIAQIYNLDVLYGYNTAYTIADAHQAYLDNLPQLLQELAEAKGYNTPAALANDLAGIGSNDVFLLEYARLLNEAYMYATTLSYYIEPTAEEVDAYFTEKEADYTQQNITRDSYLVNFRHILLVPENATVDEKGVVTASNDDWNAAKSKAESLLRSWNKNKTEANFSEIAYANTADTGSKGNGGLYSGIAKGQLTEALDTWCFDETRAVGDTAIIKTDCGYHVVYFCTPTATWYVQAERDLISDLLTCEIAVAVENYPMNVDYSAIVLDEVIAHEQSLTVDELLYPDIAHERFPVAPLYLQQDYPDTMYGNYPLVTYGCGVTTMSMLVSYMTDEEWTPPELCALYGRYCSEKGTAHVMFFEVPTDMNFYCVGRVFTWKDARPYLDEGHMVVSLQRAGFWTKRGHYLLLHNLLETEEGTKVQVRDSNVYNYGRLEGHTTGYFDLETVPPASRCYWVYEKKVTNLDSCIRCAEPTETSHAPLAMFTEGYLCPKCDEALNRRDTYLAAYTRADLSDFLSFVKVEEAIPEETDPNEHISDETLPYDPDHDFA